MQIMVVGQKKLICNPSLLSVSLTLEGLCSPELMPNNALHPWLKCDNTEGQTAS